MTTVIRLFAELNSHISPTLLSNFTHFIIIFVKNEIMTFIQFITSKSLWISVAIAVVILIVIAFISLKFLSVYTRHGEEITVPNLPKTDPDRAKFQMENIGLQMVVVDTMDLNKDFPTLSSVEQNPQAVTKVNGGRTIN